MYKEKIDLNEKRIFIQIEKIMRDLNIGVGRHMRNAGRDAVLAVIKVYADECLEKLNSRRIVGNPVEIYKFLEFRITEHEAQINDIVRQEMKEVDGEEIAEHHFIQYTEEYMPLKEERLGRVLNVITSIVPDNVELKNKIKNDEDTLKIAKAGKKWACIANCIAFGALIIAVISYYKPR